MSRAEMHHKLTVKHAVDLQTKMGAMIADALKKDYGEKYSSIKLIGRHVTASVNTIKKWYSGQNSPNSINLIMLARNSPSVLCVVLSMLGVWDDWQHLQHEKISAESRENAKAATRYSEKSFGINVKVDFAVGSKLNARQLWFLGLLQHGHQLKADHIAITWRVSTRAGEADIAGLVKYKLVRFVGAKKTGKYEIF